MATHKPIKIKITKFYLIAWIFGLLAVITYWKNWLLATGILLMIFFAYSRADYMHPPAEDNGKSGGNDDTDGFAF